MDIILKPISPDTTSSLKRDLRTKADELGIEVNISSGWGSTVQATVPDDDKGLVQEMRRIAEVLIKPPTEKTTSTDTVAKRALDSTQKHLDHALTSLANIVVYHCPGWDDYTERYYQRLRASFEQLLDVRDNLQ